LSESFAPENACRGPKARAEDNIEDIYSTPKNACEHYVRGHTYREDKAKEMAIQSMAKEMVYSPLHV